MRAVPADITRSLPTGYLAALQAFAAGGDDAAVAECAGVDPSAVDPVLRLAVAKLLAAVTPV